MQIGWVAPPTDIDIALYPAEDTLNRLISLKEKGWREDHVLPNVQFSPILDRNLAVAESRMHSLFGKSRDIPFALLKNYVNTARLLQQMSIWRYTFIHQALVCLLSDREWGENPWFMDFQGFERDVHPILIQRWRAMKDPKSTDQSQAPSNADLNQVPERFRVQINQCDSCIQAWQNHVGLFWPVATYSGVFSDQVIKEAREHGIHLISVALWVEDGQEPCDLWADSLVTSRDPESLGKRQIKRSREEPPEADSAPDEGGHWDGGAFCPD